MVSLLDKQFNSVDMQYVIMTRKLIFFMLGKISVKED